MVPAVTTGMALVFGVTGVALVLFVTEPFPPDVTALGVLVSLAVLEPYTGVAAGDAIAGFASPATVTVIAMYGLSEGVRRTGAVEHLGEFIRRVTGGDERRLLAAIVGSTGLAAGFVNNTPVVAVFIPMVTAVAERSQISPSKLLLPLSYAAMLGGTLTLLGTATNVLASDLSRDLLGRPIGMFEFTPLGLLVLAVGTAYLLTVGRALVPARVPPALDLTDAFDLENHLSRVVVREGSPLVGVPIRALLDVASLPARLADRSSADGADRSDVETEESTAGARAPTEPAESAAPVEAPATDAEDSTDSEALDVDVDLLQVERPDGTYSTATSDRLLQAGDVLTVRSTLRDLNRFAERFDLRQLPREEVTETDLSHERGTVVAAVVPPDSRLVGRALAETQFEDRFEATVLAVRRGGELRREDLDARVLNAGDALLLRTRPAAVGHMTEAGDVVVTHGPDGEPGAATPAEPPALDPRTPLALALVAGVVGVAALDLVRVVIAALGGLFAMVVTGCLSARQAYDAVSWDVVFLLAGVLPLGVAMQRTGGVDLLAALVAGVATALPPLALLAFVYLLTALLASVITPVASVVLLVPVAVDAATRVGLDPFGALLAVTFAGSSAFLTPVGYQTNLMVYGPGGYRFTDYLRVGLPLQLLLAVVVSVGIAVFFGV